MFIGRKIEVGIGKEISRGTGITPSYWLSKINADIDDKFDAVIDESSRGVIEDAEDIKIAKKYSEGQISGHITDKSVALFLLSVLGTVSSGTKAGESAVYEHTFSVQQDAQHDSLTIEMKNPNEQLKFANGVIQSFNIKAEVGKFVEFVAKIMAKLGAAATNSPSYTTENNFLAKNVTVKVAANLAGLDAASAINVKQVEINFDNNVESDDILGNVEPNDFLNKQFGITGSLELFYDATTYKALSLAGTEKALRVSIKDTAVTIGTGSNPEIKIDLAKVKFTEWAKNVGNNELVKQTLKFRALYSVSDSKMINLILTNTVAGYN